MRTKKIPDRGRKKRTFVNQVVYLCILSYTVISGGSSIFRGEGPIPKVGVRTYFLAENCMKMKEFWPLVMLSVRLVILSEKSFSCHAFEWQRVNWLVWELTRWVLLFWVRLRFWILLLQSEHVLTSIQPIPCQKIKQLHSETRMHSNTMHTASVVISGGGGFYSEGHSVYPRASSRKGLSAEGVVSTQTPPGRRRRHPDPEADTPFSQWTEWHTGVKTLPFRTVVEGNIAVYESATEAHSHCPTGAATKPFLAFLKFWDEFVTWVFHIW